MVLDSAVLDFGTIRSSTVRIRESAERPRSDGQEEEMVQDTVSPAGGSVAPEKAAAGGVPGEGFSQARKTLILTLLAAGVIAGPLYILVGVVQILIRPGFDIRRHELSLMSNGDLGWIQIANFVVTGLLVIACAIGMRLVLRGSRGGTWGPLLVAVYGAGLIAAGAFVADPMNGFPPGAPAGSPATRALQPAEGVLPAALCAAGDRDPLRDGHRDGCRVALLVVCDRNPRPPARVAAECAELLDRLLAAV